MKTIFELQSILNAAGMNQFTVLNIDRLETIVDGERTVFARSDHYGGHPLSGLATFGCIYGDWRMIEMIAEDVTEAFKLLNENES